MSAVFVTVAVLLLASATQPAKVPSFIHPCVEATSECLTQATKDAIPGFVKGIPELDIPSLDPFYIDKLTMALPGGLNFTYYNGKATGLRNCIVNNVTALVGSYQELDITCNLTVRGKYRAQGRILLFQIDGNGDAKIKIYGMHIVVRTKTRLTTDENGVHHIRTDGYKYKIDYRDGVNFQLTNLFKGNPEISQTVMTFLNENWRTVVNEFGKPIADHFLDLADALIDKFFAAVPYEEITHVPFGTARV